jgi:Zn-dependent protease/CBS domain-containing protein
MKWSWKLGQVAGIGIFVHWTFVLLIAWLAYVFVSQGTDFRGTVDGIVFVLAIFGCIVLHELGHALMARRFGIQTRDITLLPIGGVARLERMPENPTQELLVALAGPAVNVLIAVVLFAVIVTWLGIAVFSDLDVLVKTLLVSDNFLVFVMVANVALVIFNLVPAFPMDGGRVLRALLAQKLDYVQATQIAASIGQTLAILFGIVGLFGIPGLFPGQPLWLFVALFVYLGADAEAHMVRVRSVMRGVPTRAAMVTRFRAVAPTEPLSAAIQELLAGHQQDFPVMEGDRLVGMLIRRDLLAALAEGKHDLPIGDVMRRDVRTVDEAEMLDGTFQRMREGECSTAPVLREGRLVGLLTLENVGEWMMIQSALRKALARGDVEDIFRIQGTGDVLPARLPPSLPGLAAGPPPEPTPHEPRP